LRFGPWQYQDDFFPQEFQGNDRDQQAFSAEEKYPEPDFRGSFYQQERDFQL